MFFFYLIKFAFQLDCVHNIVFQVLPVHCNIHSATEFLYLVTAELLLQYFVPDVL